MSASCDILFLGSGHNALVAQAYLARAGLRTLCLEQSPVAGGGLATIENPHLPGFLHNPHSFFHRGITAMPWYRDLELESLGARYVEPALNVALLCRDGRRLEWWVDPERTITSFANFSKQDAVTLRRWMDEFRPIATDILAAEAQSPPLPREQRRALLNRTPAGRRLLDVSACSPLEFVTREFENDTIRAGLLFFNGLREIDLRQRGFGHAIPALLASPRKAQLCIGGSANLARALVAAIEQHGGQIRCGVSITRILLHNGNAVGVELNSGEVIHAQTVVSGLNPQQTFLQLLPAESVPAALRAQAAGFQYNLLAPLFGLHVALDAPPQYGPFDEPPFMTILGLERFGQFHDIVRAHERGEIPDTVAWGACPTLHDPSQAPPHQHTAFLWEKLPFALRGDAANWKRETAAHAQRLLDFWADYAPNLRASVLDQFALSPADTVATLPNMTDGDLLVGAFSNDQVGHHRPFPGAGNYRTPIGQLYLCGGSTHPGGNITGLCGYNAANVIAADAGIKHWWNPPNLVAHLESLR